MKKEYFVYVCSCGSIHFIPREAYDAAMSNDEQILLICRKCGHSTVFGSDNWDDEHYLYSHDFNNDVSLEVYGDRIAAVNEQSNIHEKFMSIFVDRGYRPYLLTKDKSILTANAYIDGFFYGMDGEKYSNKVDMEELISDLGDEKCYALSAYTIPGLNWYGTKYKPELN